MNDLTQIGGEVGNFLGSILNPVFGNQTTTTSTTTGGGSTASASGSTSKTSTYLIIGFVALVLVGSAIFLLKNKN